MVHPINVPQGRISSIGNPSPSMIALASSHRHSPCCLYIIHDSQKNIKKKEFLRQLFRDLAGGGKAAGLCKTACTGGARRNTMEKTFMKMFLFIW